MGYSRQNPKSTYCLFRDSEKVRAAIELKIKQSGMTTIEISRKSGVPAKSISRWRNYHRNISQYDLLRLADFLGIDIDVKVEFRA